MNGSAVVVATNRPPRGHDPCIGRLADVWSACYGHGEHLYAYVSFKRVDHVTGAVVRKLVRASDLHGVAPADEPAEVIAGLVAEAESLPDDRPKA